MNYENNQAYSERSNPWNEEDRVIKEEKNNQA